MANYLSLLHFTIIITVSPSSINTVQVNLYIHEEKKKKHLLLLVVVYFHQV
jgi:hypothetical protein